jgi:chromosome segregation ATPase
MDLMTKIQKVKIQFLAAAISGTVLFSGAVLAAEPAAAVKKDDPKASFEAKKAEWETIRDQQIAMIQKKEEQLEELKERLFQQMNAPKGAGEKVAADSGEVAPQGDVLKGKIAEIKEANRRLSDEIVALKARNSELEKKAKATTEKEQLVILQKQIAEFETQKAAFLKERQKFFQESSRQRARIQAQMDALAGKKT